MKEKSLRKVSAAAAILSMLILSAGFQPGIARAEDGTSCSAITLNSGTSTQAAGFTATDPVSSPLTASMYSGGSFSAAMATETVIPPWVDPSAETSLSGSSWVSTDASWPGGSGNTEGSATSSQWRLFQHTFTVPATSTASSSHIAFSADNAVAVYLNGSLIATTGSSADVYGTSTSGTSHFGTVYHADFTPVAGANTLSFVVRNWGGEFTSNPTGLIYKATVNHCSDIAEEGAVVTIVKYLDGQKANPNSASSTAFTMNASWDADNIGSGSGQFTLGPSGGDGSYKATTSLMSLGASYSVSEDLTGDMVGASCDSGKPYALVGYTVANNMGQAAMMTPTSTMPSLNDLSGNKTIIVWNQTCDDQDDETSTSTVRVHIQKYLDGNLANATSSGGYLFPMSATWQAANLNGGATSTGTFFLGNNAGGATDAYGAMTAEMQAPAYYSVSEVTTGTSTQVLAPGATCEAGKFRLEGYRHSSVSFADAATNGTLATSSPALSGLEGDHYIIVYNADCDTVLAEGEDLQITGVDVLKGTSTAAGTWEDGWKYVFHITAPSNEQNLAMKFSDWMHSSASATIPVANNMRISSAQAASTSTVMITAADTYSSPALHLTGDMNSSTTGRQVDVLVEVKVPTGTQTGSYTTNFGIRTLP